MVHQTCGPSQARAWCPAWVTWPAEQVTGWASDFFDNLDPGLRQGMGRERFLRDFALMGVQRHIKAAGIFARLKHRDGKQGYIKDIPRTVAYIQALAPEYPELGLPVPAEQGLEVEPIYNEPVTEASPEDDRWRR